jgi:hypothetical protein
MGNQSAKTGHFSIFKAFFRVHSSATDKGKNEEGQEMDVLRRLRLSTAISLRNCFKTSDEAENARC